MKLTNASHNGYTQSKKSPRPSVLDWMCTFSLKLDDWTLIVAGHILKVHFLNYTLQLLKSYAALQNTVYFWIVFI